ncbi:MAG: sucrase ferredoxin [Rubrobacteraceae bacterium]
MEANKEVKLCSVVSSESGDDPIGSATPFEKCLMVEVSPPYQRNALDSRRFPKGLAEVVDGAMDGGSIQKFGAFMPDREHSEKGCARVLFFRRPEGDAFSSFEKDDLLAPNDDLAPVVEALLSGNEFPEKYRRDSSGVREIFVCTHNNRDVCCGKFGDPVYKELRRKCADDTLRVWRASHIGGHRFAPTLIDFPSGMWWGHLGREEAASLVRRDAPFANFRNKYRGWSGLGSNFEQIAEREILAETGWRWADFPRQGELLSVNEDETLAEVRMDFEDPKAREGGSYHASIEASDSVMTLGSSGTDPLEEVTQYRVSRLERV